ncbi:hypothetical protein [Azotobacter salinestris]|uniref:hypothetical protein n=1 Tax=Azotobacter salinestris TaxID=69964 RepID=UPI0032DFF2C5
MDNNKDPGSNLGLWLPGGAVIISLVVSTFALTRKPFLEARPTGVQFQVERQIEARLWQDPFDALERHRKKLKESKSKENESSNTTGSGCDTRLPSELTQSEPSENPHTTLEVWTTTATEKTSGHASITTGISPSTIVGQPDSIRIEVPLRTPGEALTDSPTIMAALVPSGPYADEVESRRRIRYAILVGLKNARMVPENAQHIGCLIWPPSDQETSSGGNPIKQFEIPYETFIANLLNPPTATNDSNKKHRTARTILFWIKEEYLGTEPLKQLEQLRSTLQDQLKSQTKNNKSQSMVLKVIGPSNSMVLRLMYLEDANEKKKRKQEQEQEQNFSNIEIYSPLATTPKAILVRDLEKSLSSETDSEEKQQEEPTDKESIKLLRTVSNDNTLTIMLLEELKRRGVDPVHGLRCSQGAPTVVGSLCQTTDWRQRSSRIALISEWDSFYSRAISEIFNENIVKRAGGGPFAEANVGGWVLQFSYLRGLDGMRPEESASDRKFSGKENARRDGNPLDIGSLETADGNSQLDYLRRLADHIVERDETYRRNGESGIGAIGVLGTDAYDKLLVLQALKSRMPNKVFFSTDLDARMLQRGQAETVRNLVLASPYGLTLTRELQQDVPPFRDSLQSAVFVAVLAAQASQPFEEKRAKFDYYISGLLSPGIYEVGIRGFIPLKSSHADVCQASARVRWRATGAENDKSDIMTLPCLQDEPSLPYPDLSDPARDRLDRLLSMWWARPLSAILVALAIFLGWWWIEKEKEEKSSGTAVAALPRWVCNLPLALHVAAALSALSAVWLWRVEFMWTTFFLILLSSICSKLINCQPKKGKAPASTGGGLFDSSAYYIVVPIVVFILLILCAYQQRLSLTEEGLGEPMFLFEGISAWPTLGLRLLAVLISISALAWGWRNLRINRTEIKDSHHLQVCPSSLWPKFSSHDDGKRQTFREWLVELGNYLFRILFPLSSSSMVKIQEKMTNLPSQAGMHTALNFEKFWNEYCMCGTFGARMLRAVLATWIFVVATSALYVLWPMEGTPIRGEWESQTWALQMLSRSWMVPILAFQLLVFWVVDANRLLVHFIRQLSSHSMHWPKSLRKKHERIFGIDKRSCIDAWVDMMLIAQHTAAVNRLIYAPTVVLLILIMSHSSVFDNWPTPPSLVISYLLTALVLFVSALSLRRAAEKARVTALGHIDKYLLETPASKEGYDKCHLIRERITALNKGAFSRYSEEPLVRALLLSLAGIGGSAIVEVLNYSKF